MSDVKQGMYFVCIIKQAKTRALEQVLAEAAIWRNFQGFFPGAEHLVGTIQRAGRERECPYLGVSTSHKLSDSATRSPANIE